MRLHISAIVSLMAFEAMHASPEAEKALEVSGLIASSRSGAAVFYFKEFLNGLALNLPNLESDHAIDRERVKKKYSKAVSFLARSAGLAVTGSIILGGLHVPGGAALGPLSLGFPFKQIAIGIGGWLVWKDMSPKKIRS